MFSSQTALADAKKKRRDAYFYGRFGTPTVFSLEDALADLEGGARGFVVPSGLFASLTAIKAFARAGDHMLVGSSSFGALKKSCLELQRHDGVELDFFDTSDVGAMLDLVRSNTKVIYVENPGCSWFNFADIRKLVEVKLAHDVKLVVDNTWATPLFCRPIELGADVVVHSLTKYIGGHDDIMMGAIICNEPSLASLSWAIERSGTAVSPDDAYLALRGLRSLSVRLQRHSESGEALAKWLCDLPGIDRVIHPSLASHPDHHLFRRDFDAASGLFSVVFEQGPAAALGIALNETRLFGNCVGWGGFSSTIEAMTTKDDPSRPLPAARLHIGLEDPDDLKRDLELLVANYVAQIDLASVAD